MNTAVKAAVILAAAVAVVTIAFITAGLHENPIMGLGFVVVAIGLNIGAVVWALKQTAAETTYLKQLANGAVIGLVAGVLIFATSFITQSYIFPDSLQESIDGQVAMLENNPSLSEEQVDAAMARIDNATVMSGAVQGLIFTFLTSVIVAAIAAIFLRKK